MRFPIVASVVLLSTLLVGQTQPTSSPTVLRADGASASFSGAADGAFTFVSVFRGADFFTGEKITSLSINFFRPTSDGFEETGGFGIIPNDAFTGENAEHLTLNVDTSQVPSFSLSTCIFSGIITCTPAPGGVISIDWKQSRNFSRHDVATTQQTFVQFSIQSSGESDQGSAIANGSLFDSPVDNVPALSGTNRSRMISISRNPGF